MPIQDGLITCSGFVGSIYTLKDGTTKLTLEIDRKDFLKELHAIDELFQQKVIIHVQDYEKFISNDNEKETIPGAEEKDTFAVPPPEYPNITYSGIADGSTISIEDIPKHTNDYKKDFRAAKLEDFAQYVDEVESYQMPSIPAEDTDKIIDSEIDNEAFYEDLKNTNDPSRIEESWPHTDPKIELEYMNQVGDLTKKIPDDELKAFCKVGEEELSVSINKKRSSANLHLLNAGMADKRASILMAMYKKTSLKELSKEELDSLLEYITDGDPEIKNYTKINNKLSRMLDLQKYKGEILQ